MSEIKVKEKQKGTIKTLDKSLIATQKMKENILRGKEISNDFKTDNYDSNETDFARDKVENTLVSIKDTSINTFNKYGKKSVQETKNNVLKAKDKINDFKIKRAEKKLREKAGDTTKSTIKKSTKTIKNTTNTTKKAIKTVENTEKALEKTAKAQAKAAKRTAQMIKASAEAAARATKATVKAIIATIKAILAALKGLIAFLIAGGWVVVLIIIVICLVALIVYSVFGIFFVNENSSDGSKGLISMDTAISILNSDFVNKLAEIQRNNKHDSYSLICVRTDWEDLLAVYAVKVNGGFNENEVMTLDEEKLQILKDVFWDMTKIGVSLYNKEDKKIELQIVVSSKSVSEMADEYNFNDEQREQLAMLTSDKYDDVWHDVITGGSGGSSDIVAVAKQQIGNVGGQTFWAWYGFSERVEWCACFVSWCANQCGYINSGIIPKFASCESEGVSWFQASGLWQEKGYTPKAGDIIFFDWADKHDGQADHVGIVEKVEGGRVYTIEGNSNDSCKENNYDINSDEIRGYGTPLY